MRRLSLLAVTTALVAGCVIQISQPQSDGGAGGSGAVGGGNGGGTSGGGASHLLQVLATDAETGKSGKLRVFLTNPASSDTTVTLSSSNAAIATLAGTVVVPRGSLSVDVDWSGVAPGQALLTVTLGDDRLSASVGVVDKNQCGRSVGAVTLEVGADATLNVYCDYRVSAPRTITLTVGNTTVASATTATLAPFGSNSAQVLVHGIAVGDAALSIDSQSVGVVKVVDAAKFANVNLPTSVVVGAQLQAGITLDAYVASARTITITGLGPSQSVTVPAGGISGIVLFNATTPGGYDLTFTMGSVTLTRHLEVVAAPGLSQIYVSGALAVGSTTSYLTIYLNQSVVTPLSVTLTSSDPTVLPVPATASVLSGSYAQVPLTPLKTGTVLITATAGGTTSNVVASVTSSGSGGNGSLRAYTSTNNYLIGAIGYLSINSSESTLTLTSSDPTVVSLPSKVNGPYATVYFLALKPGNVTLTIAGASSSVTLPVNVITSPQLSTSPIVSIAPGATYQQYFQLNAMPAAGTSLTFESSNPAVVAAPGPVAMDQNYVQVSLTALTGGTAIITGHLGSASASVLVIATNNSSQGAVLSSVSPNSAQVQVGAVTQLYTNLNTTTQVEIPLTVSIDNPAVLSVQGAVPTIGVGYSSTSFFVAGLAPGTSTVTVKALGGSVTSSTIKVVSLPTLTFSSGSPFTLSRNARMIDYIRADSTLAQDITVNLVSSDPIVAVPPSVRIGIGNGEQNPQASFPLVIGDAGVMTDGGLRITASWGGNSVQQVLLIP